MVVNLHFQFAKQEPNTFQLELGMPGNRRLHAGDGIWLNDKARRKIRETYKKVFHRKLTNTFTFHTGKEINTGHNFNYNSRNLYRIVIPEGRKKHLWTNGRRVRTRVRNRFGRWRWR